MDLLLFGIIIVLATVIPIFFVNKTFIGSDNTIQLNIIEQIRLNRHHFIRKSKSFLFCDDMIYPQFLYWILSFIGKRSQGIVFRYLFVVFHFLVTLAFVLFLKQIYPYIDNSIVSEEEFIFWSGLVYLLNPFNFNINNARNTGVSTRGIGLLFGSIYLYLIVLYNLQGSIVYLVLAGLASLLTLVTSQMAMQMKLFSMPILMLFFKSWVIGIPLLGSLLVFYMLMPGYATMYLKGQIRFKYFYFKYLAKNILLSKRYSIWRDFVWDFWKIIFNGFKHKGQVKKGLLYFYDNPILVLGFSLPFCIPLLLVYTGLVGIDQAVFQDKTLISLFAILISMLILFLLTSFRLTRFLGEPERYVEFSMGLVAPLAVIVFKGQGILLPGILTFCFLFNFIQFIAMRKRVKDSQMPGFFSDLAKVNSILEKEDGEIRLLSNNNQISKLLISDLRRVFFGWPYSEKIGPFHFNDIYTTDQYIKLDMLDQIAVVFKIDFLVLDKLAIVPNDPISLNIKKYKMVVDLTDITLYKVSKDA